VRAREERTIEMVEEVKLSSAVSVSSGAWGIRQAFQPPFSKNLFHIETATPAAMAVRNSNSFSFSWRPLYGQQILRVRRPRLIRGQGPD
jgi:hypothetical protein